MASTGPILARRCACGGAKQLVAEVTNSLPEATTMHWHGLIIPGAADGGPHEVIAPGRQWRTEFRIDQPAATLWFHPHNYPSTAEQVIKGIAGLLIVDDDEASALPLPSRWGVDDIPLILQDRRFTPEGQFFDRMNIVAVTNGYVGDVMLVNGALYPEARAARGWLRLRILNGSNARSYRLAASDGRSLFVIASDGGLLESPVELKEIVVHVGERFEILVDGRDGAAFDIVTLPVAQAIMRLPPFDRPLPLVTIRPDGAEGTGKLPSRLAALPPLPDAPPPVSQNLVMDMFDDKQGMMLLDRAGLMSMGGGMGVTPSVAKSVTKLIVDEPAMTEADQLAANGVNGRPFALGRIDFAAARGRAAALAHLGRQRPDAASRARSRMPVPHPHDGRQAAGTLSGGLEGHRARIGRRRHRDPRALSLWGGRGASLHGALPHSGARGFRHDGAVHGRLRPPPAAPKPIRA